MQYGHFISPHPSPQQSHLQRKSGMACKNGHIWYQQSLHDFVIASSYSAIVHSSWLQSCLVAAVLNLKKKYLDSILLCSESGRAGIDLCDRLQGHLETPILPVHCLKEEIVSLTNTLISSSATFNQLYNILWEGQSEIVEGTCSKESVTDLMFLVL